MACMEFAIRILYRPFFYYQNHGIICFLYVLFRLGTYVWHKRGFIDAVCCKVKLIIYVDS